MRDMQKEGNRYKVELRDISKSFGGISALQHVTLGLRKGEIHALIGENGAGKSTLMKILSGAYQKDQGQIFIDGKEVSVRNTMDSQKFGIRIIYQEFSLIPELSIAENIFISHLKERSAWINRKKMRIEADKIISELGFEIDSSLKVKHLSIAQQQVVEIAKALAFEVEVLILDEPSAVLGAHEIRKLFATLRKLRDRGVAIVFISHHLEEIFELADVVTVLKNGQTIGTKPVRDTTTDEIIRMMLGRSLDSFFPKREAAIGEPALTVKNLQLDNWIKDINLAVKSGEVVGIAGLVGSGRTEVLQGIFSVRERLQGDIRLLGKPVNYRSPHRAVRAGLGMVPEDRKSQGLVIRMSVSDNITLPNLKACSNRLGFIKSRKEADKVSDLMDDLKIKAGRPNISVGALSGGNQQKVVIAKWVDRNCKVLLIDEPTRGVDVGAKVEIYNQINRLAAEGIGILVVSSETAELIGICDRIMVMAEGKIRGQLNKSEFSEENILRLALSN